MVETDIISIPPHIHDRSLSWLGTGTSIYVPRLNHAFFVKNCGHTSVNAHQHI